MLRLALILALLAPTLAPASTPRILQFLEDRHTHAIVVPNAEPPGGDPAARGRADCSAIRALDRRDANAAREIGRMFEKAGVQINRLVTSGICRLVQAAMAFELGPVTWERMLDPVPADRQAEAVDIVLSWLDGLRPSETALLVIDAGLAEALTGARLAPGEGVVFRLPPGGEVQVLDRFSPKAD